MTDLTRHQFAAVIMETLKAHPDWLNTAMQATHEGIVMAMADLQARHAKTNAAMLAALCLASSKGRIQAATREALAPVIRAALDPTHASPIEREFLGGGA